MFNFEPLHKPVLPKKKFIQRQVSYVFLALMIIVFSLLVGIIGYHALGGLGRTDSLLNASMILGGMGPVDILTSNAAKVFASFYALYSGMILLSTFGILFTPILHRFLHLMHVKNKN